jgi:hypothetical protein
VGQADAIITSPPWQDSIGNAAGCPDVKTVRPHLPLAAEVAAYLKACRLARGLTRREVDRHLGTNTLYSWYEGRPAGFEIPTPEHWRELKPLLGLDDRFDHGILTEAVVDATGRLTTDKTGHAVMGDYGTAPGQVGALRAGPCPGGEAGVGDDVETLTWGGCYSQGWGRTLLSPGAFSHPAKFAYGLLTRLYDHGFERGWWRKGDLVADPFGGVGCGGVVAAYRGLRWVGCELEPRFVALAEETFALHRGKWAAAGDTPPLILQGDSRSFAAVVACVTSPTWVDPRGRLPQDAQGDSRQSSAPAAGAAAACITSPPWQNSLDRGTVTKSERIHYAREHGIANAEHVTPVDVGHARQAGYGTTPGQLGALKAGDAEAVLTSPPYAEGCAQTGGADLHPERFHGGNHPPVLRDYGTTPGNVGGLPAGDAGAVVTSPPYESGGHHADQTGAWGGCAGKAQNHTKDVAGYGLTQGQVGQERGDTYWSAMKIIWEQAFLALRPNGVLCCVIKDFVRAKKRVPLCDQTWRLLLSLGFIPVERIRCLLSEETREPSLFGGCEVKKRSRVSFFRRLATKRGAPEIPYEEILVVRRPGGVSREGPCPDT